MTDQQPLGCHIDYLVGRQQIVDSPGGSDRGWAGPLAGVRVVDLTSVIMGPWATQILGDLGCDVITIEPTNGTLARVMSPGPIKGLSGIALNLLRNKRNVALDLKRDEAIDITLRLIDGADVFVTNLRPGALARLGLDAATLLARNPRLVYCQAQGFPTDSERANDPAYDDIIQAHSGLADLFARVEGVPKFAPTVLADKISGLTMVYGILAALMHRERTGEGQAIEVAMTEAMRAFLLVEHGAAGIGRPQQGEPGYRRILNAERRPQRTADGWVHILPYGREHYEELFRAAGRDDLIGDPRIQSSRSRIENAAALYSIIAEIAVSKTTDEWMAFCSKHRIPSSRVTTIEEVVDGLPTATHPRAGDFGLSPGGVRFGGSPTDDHRLPAALTGEHTIEVLEELGLSKDEIRALTEAGITRTIEEDTVG